MGRNVCVEQKIVSFAEEPGSSMIDLMIWRLGNAIFQDELGARERCFVKSFPKYFLVHTRRDVRKGDVGGDD